MNYYMKFELEGILQGLLMPLGETAKVTKEKNFLFWTQKQSNL